MIDVIYVANTQDNTYTKNGQLNFLPMKADHIWFVSNEGKYVKLKVSGITHYNNGKIIDIEIELVEILNTQGKIFIQNQIISIDDFLKSLNFSRKN